MFTIDGNPFTLTSSPVYQVINLKIRVSVQTELCSPVWVSISKPRASAVQKVLDTCTIVKPAMSLRVYVYMSTSRPCQQSIHLLSTEGTTQFRPEEFSSIFINLSNLVTSKACGSDLLHTSAVTDECSCKPNDKLVAFGTLVHEQSHLNQGHRIQLMWK